LIYDVCDGRHDRSFEAPIRKHCLTKKFDHLNMAKKKAAIKETPKSVETITHTEEKRRNIPTIEYRSMVRDDQQSPIPVRYPRNTDLDPQLVWRGKDEQDWSDLVVNAPPLYIQEKVHPKVLIDDLMRQKAKSEKTTASSKDYQLDLFSDFNGVPDGDAKTEFYQHDQNWSNRMILGDSLQVMASLAEREGLRGKVQCIYFDPPYGIKFNSNFQWSTTSRDVKDGKSDHITREPEQVKAFRDTWRDGIHSYLTYLRDRLTVMRDLLTESGSVFVQIGDENLHHVRELMDEVFGEKNFVSLISFAKGAGLGSNLLTGVNDFLLWYAKDFQQVKYRQIYQTKTFTDGGGRYNQVMMPNRVIRPATKMEKEEGLTSDSEAFLFMNDNLTKPGPGSRFVVRLNGKSYRPEPRWWGTTEEGLTRAIKADRIAVTGNSIAYRRYLNDFTIYPITNSWTRIGGVMSRSDPKVYVVQTSTAAVERCILMTSDPGDLVLDPTCGSGTAAYAAEQWGRRWITIDTSRVALALARARIMGAKFPYFFLADSKDGQLKEADVNSLAVRSRPVYNSVRQGFVYERTPHITLASIANNAEIDVIWDKWQASLEPLRQELNQRLKRTYEEWQIPRDAEDPWPAEAASIHRKIRTEQSLGENARPGKLKEFLSELNKALKRKPALTLEKLPERPVDRWDDNATELHRQWWEARIARQKEIDASIAAKAEFEYLYDKPYEDKKKVRVAGPFTVESLSPHRSLGVDENDDLIDPMMVKENRDDKQTFPQMILENLRTAGVQQTHKADRIEFNSLVAWPGDNVCAEGRYQEGDKERRAAIMIGPEFGTVQRQDLVLAAREAGDAGFDVLIACAFNFDAMSTEFNKLGKIPVLKARMNADLHMADDLKNTGKGNLFVIFGEPDIELLEDEDGMIRVKVNGVDVFHPNTGEVRSDGPDGIACWFLDTDYNEESFFVRHAYFLGQNDPYTALKTSLKAEIDADAWSTLHSDTSRPFPKPPTGRIAVKVINHLGDEVMKVFRVK
jgi:adenine-specific DNA-methyltransferase